MGEAKVKETGSVQASRKARHMDKRILGEPLAKPKEMKESLEAWTAAGSPRRWIRDQSYKLVKTGGLIVADYDVGYGYMRLMILDKTGKVVEGVWCSACTFGLKLREFLVQYEGEDGKLVLYRVYK